MIFGISVPLDVLVVLSPWVLLGVLWLLGE